jgi:DNA-binding MarR family transcriptional regulator
MVAEFEADLIRPTAHPGRDEGGEGQGSASRQAAEVKPNQAKHLLELHDSEGYTQGELAELFGVGRSTVYRTIQRMRL